MSKEFKYYSKSATTSDGAWRFETSADSCQAIHEAMHKQFHLRRHYFAFIHMLESWSFKISSIIENALLQVKADILVCSLRDFENHGKISQKMLRKFEKEALAYLRDLQQSFEQVANQVRSRRFDNYKLHKVVNSFEEVERGFVLQPSGPIQIFSSAVVADQRNLYIFDEREGGRVYSADRNASIGVEGVRMSLQFEGVSNCYVKGVCNVEGIGDLILLLTPQPAKNKLGLSKSKYQLELHAVSTELSSYSNIIGKDFHIYDSFCLYDGGSKYALVIDLSQANLLFVDFNAEANCIKQKIQLNYDDGNLRSFGYNSQSRLALATRLQTARIFQLDGKGGFAYKHVVICNNDKERVFGQCAVSSHPIFFIATAASTERTAFIQLFSITGQQLRLVPTDSSALRIFNANLIDSKGFAINECPKSRELCLIYVSGDYNLEYIRVRSSRRAFANLVCELPFEGDSTVSPIGKVDHQKVSKTEKLLIKLSSLHATSDRNYPSLRCISEGELAYYFFDIANNAIKRLKKSEMCDPEEYNPEYLCSQYAPNEQLNYPENKIMSMALLDERTLLVLYGSCTLVHVNALTMRSLRSVRFTSSRVVDLSGNLIVVEPRRVFASFWQDSRVFEIHRRHEDSTDWRLMKLHKLPSQWKLCHLNFDNRNRKFSLVILEESYGVGQVIILNSTFSVTHSYRLQPIYSDTKCFSCSNMLLLYFRGKRQYQWCIFTKGDSIVLRSFHETQGDCYPVSLQEDADDPMKITFLVSDMKRRIVKTTFCFSAND